MELKQKVFNNIASLYLKMRNGLMNNNMSFDHLLNDLIQNIENQFNSIISKTVLYSKNSLRQVFKYWMSVYGVVLNYGYVFPLIGYLGNNFDVQLASDFLFKDVPNVSPDMGVDLMSMLSSIKTEVLNQDPNKLQELLSNDVLVNCVLNIDTRKVLNGNLFINNAKQMLEDYQTIKQAMNDERNKEIIIDYLLNNILDDNSKFYQALINFKNAHNRYSKLKMQDKNTILDVDDKLENINNILEMLISIISSTQENFNGLIFHTNIDTHSIIDITSVLVNNSLANALNDQYKNDFTNWDDIFYPIGGMTVSFKETSLSEYIDNIPGINLLYKYTHISYMSQSEIAIYLEQVINLFSSLYIQTVNKHQLNIDIKIFTNLSFQLKTVLKDYYQTIVDYINSISNGTLDMGIVVYSSFFDPSDLLLKIVKK